MNSCASVTHGQTTSAPLSVHEVDDEDYLEQRQQQYTTWTSLLHVFDCYMDVLATCTWGTRISLLHVLVGLLAESAFPSIIAIAISPTSSRYATFTVSSGTSIVAISEPLFHAILLLYGLHDEAGVQPQWRHAATSRWQLPHKAPSAAFCVLLFA